MVVVAMSQEQGPDPALLGEGERRGEGPGIEGQNAVDQERDEAGGAALLVVGPKDFQFHGCGSQEGVGAGERSERGHCSTGQGRLFGRGLGTGAGLTARRFHRYHM